MKNSLSALSLVLALNTICQSFTAQIIQVSGDITENTTWSSDKVQVTGNVTINDDITLIIEPGTLVEFQGKYALFVKGSMIARGQPGDSIAFYPVNITEGWQGIRIDNSETGLNGAMNDNDSTILNCCKFSYGIQKGTDSNTRPGGALYVNQFSKIRVTGCRFFNNFAYYGGAVACYSADVYISGCKFQNNSGDDDNASLNNGQAGAVYYLYCLSPVLENNIFIGNYGECYGAVSSRFSDAIVRNNRFINNSAKFYGGALGTQGCKNLLMINNLIVNNTASKGGGLYFDTGDPILINNTISNNTASNGGGMYCTYIANTKSYNTIFWGNTATNGNQISIADNPSNPSFYNCVIQGGLSGFYLGSGVTYDGELKDTLLRNPQFVSPSTTPGKGFGSLSNDFSLKNNSPAINKGKTFVPGYLYPGTDLAGKSRISYGQIDIGAYEFSQPVQTFSGAITGKTFWAADVIKVTGDITINNGATLTVLPDVYVEFQGKYLVKVQGRIVASGREGQEITFTTNDTTGFHNLTFGGWKGFEFSYTPETNDSSIFDNCLIEYVNSNGLGAIFLNSFSKLAIRNTTIRNNYGSGILAYGSPILMTNCLIENNRANVAAGLCLDYSDFVIKNCTIRDNKAIVYRGGGVGLERGARVWFINSFIVNNTAVTNGGGISCNISSPVFLNTIIANNSCDGEGGGMYYYNSGPLIINTNIINNYSHTIGGAVSLNNSRPDFINSIICGNEADSAGNQIYIRSGSIPDFFSCNIGGDSTDFGYDKYTRFSGIFADNIDADPEFKNPSSGVGYHYDAMKADWRISDFSPCINAGSSDTSSYYIHTSDLYGNKRINSSQIDIGSCENQGMVPQIQSFLLNLVKCMDDSAKFEIKTNDTASYQWQKDGLNVLYGTNSVLEFDSVTFMDQGNYQCVVSNAYGSVTSNVAFLQVNEKPLFLSEPENTWAEEGKTTILRTYAKGTNPSFQWQKNGNDITGSNDPELDILNTAYDDQGEYLCIASNSCGQDTTSHVTLYLAPQICMVTVSTLTGKNLVVWEKNTTAPIAEYKIYRESDYAGIYDLLANLPYNALSIFVDTTADPTVQAYLYKITAVDNSGIETDINLCKIHKTIHLLASTNPETQSTQLDWDRYVGFDFGTYEIFRSETSANFTSIHTMSSSTYTWADPDPGTATQYYRIAALRPVPCNPTGASGTKADSGPYSHSMSNIDDNRFQTGISEHLLKIEKLIIYPNPFNESATLNFSNPEGFSYTLYIIDLTGKVCRIVDNITTSQYVLEKGDMKEGFYFIELKGFKLYRGHIIVE